MKAHSREVLWSVICLAAAVAYLAGCEGGNVSDQTGQTTLGAGLDGPLNGHINSHLNGHANGSMNGSLNGAVNGAVNGTINGTINGTSNATYNGAFDGTLNGNPFSGQLNGAVNGSLNGNYNGSLNGNFNGLITGVVAPLDLDGLLGADFDGDTDVVFGGEIGIAPAFRLCICSNTMVVYTVPWFQSCPVEGSPAWQQHCG